MRLKRKKLGLRATYRIVEPLAKLYATGAVILTAKDAARILGDWATMHERVGLQPQALALREASVWMASSEYDPTPEDPNRITFRELQKQFREVVSEAELQRGSA